MSSPETKRKIKQPSLPYDLLLNCLARVSRLYYPTLSLVSKSFGSLLASPDLYKYRSLLNNTESCLYVCVQCLSFEYSWYTLCRKPNQTLTNENTNTKKSSGYVLVRVPNPDTYSAPTNVLSLVSVGSCIYNVGTKHSSSAWILDCETHMWHEGPRLPVQLESFSACVLDEKIYVAGCYIDGDDSGLLKNWFEVFDTKTQIWEPKPLFSTVTEGQHYNKSERIDGKLHVMFDRKVVGYDPKEGRWDVVEYGMWAFMFLASACAINNVLYSVHTWEKNATRDFNECFLWYDTEVRMWKKLKGLVGLPKFPPKFPMDVSCRLADYGGKMAVLWDSAPSVKYRKMVWCAVIALERGINHDIWGKVEWFDNVLPVHIGYGVVKVLGVTV